MTATRPGHRPAAAPGGLVYSTDSGRMCPGCRKPLAQCVCGQARPVPAGDGVVRVSREKKGRGGKTVTLARGLALPAAELAALGRELRTTCGSGGTAGDGVVAIQGDHVDRVMQVLQAKGYTVRRAGG
jgi:translation initiation factor 1